MKNVMKFIVIVIIVFTLSSCSSSIEDVQAYSVYQTAETTPPEIVESENSIYIINLKIGIDRFALDFENMIKDSFNDFNFEIPVSKEYYDSLQVGDRLNEKTRMGSLILKGSYGKQYVEVIEKRIENQK